MYQAELYSKSNNGARTAIVKILKKYGHLLHWNKNETILELGIGDGLNSDEVVFSIFPNDIKEYIGTDRAPSMVEHAKKTIKSAKAQFSVLDITNRISPEFENRFDHIFSFFMLHWVQEPKVAIKNLYDMLKHGGETFNVLCSESIVDSVFDKMLAHPKWSIYEKEKYSSMFYKDPNILDIYREFFEGYGFIDCVIKYEEYIYQFKNNEEFEQLVIAINPSIAKIPANLLNEYVTDYLNECRKSPLYIYKQLDNGKDEISMVIKCIFLYGRKSKKISF